MADGFSCFRLVYAGGLKFPFQADILAPFFEGHSEIVLRKNCDYVAWFQGQVIGLIPLQHQLSQIEWDEPSRQVLGVQALIHRIFQLISGALRVI